MTNQKGKDRLIVALDVPTHKQAFELVACLDNVSFFKVGLELLLAGDLLGFLRRLQERRSQDGGVFVDLKTAGDIGNTIARVVRQLQSLNVKFLTLTETVPLALTLANVRTIRTARGSDLKPQLLMVPMLSSLDKNDLLQGGLEVDDLDVYIRERGRKMLSAGCDGLIVSGQAIRACRDAFPSTVIVSPGIRPVWAQADDHKRHATPAQAINLGADYLVVGRPITQNQDPRNAAARIIDEIDKALETGGESATNPIQLHQALAP